jgi:hypothetical protein
LSDRRLLDCYGVPDSRLLSALHPPGCAAIEILERYSLRTFLALPQVRRLVKSLSCSLRQWVKRGLKNSMQMTRSWGQ